MAELRPYLGIAELDNDEELDQEPRIKEEEAREDGMLRPVLFIKLHPTLECYEHGRATLKTEHN